MAFKQISPELLEAIDPELRPQRIEKSMRAIEAAHGYSLPGHRVRAGEYDPSEIPSGYEKFEFDHKEE